MKRSTRLLLLPLFLVACAQPAADETAEKASGIDEAAAKAAVDAADAKLADAFKAGDVAAAMTLYDANVVVMAPNAPASTGLAENEKGIRDFLSAFTVKDFTVTANEVMVAGDMVISRSTWKMTIAPKAGGPDMPDNGKSLTVWKQQADGSWKIFRDIWNSDVPLPTGK